MKDNHLLQDGGILYFATFHNSYFTSFSNGIANFGLPQSKSPYQIDTDVPQNNITQGILCLETEKKTSEVLLSPMDYTSLHYWCSMSSNI